MKRSWWQDRAQMAGLALLLSALSTLRGAPPSAEAETAALASIYTTSAAKPSKAHRGPLMREFEPLLIQQGRALVALLRPWPASAGAAHLPLEKGSASSEHGIRPNAATAKGLALLVRLAPDEAFPTDFTRRQARAGALSLVRYLVHTHGASEETSADGKPWHNQWQSAYWAAMAGEACWLLWDDLSPEERWLAARMVCDEADRFVGVTPPVNLFSDSKAEENAWNSQVISLAYNFFPQHPRHSLWRENAIRWIAASFCTARDAASDTIVDGRPLKEWLTGPNLHADFTLENHNRVHPDYMACTYLLTSQIPMYAWGGNRPPAAIHLNVEAINAVVKRLATPEGSVIYPNGQDWGLHRNIDWLEYHGTMAALYGDRQSAALLRHAIEAARRMAARNPAGTIYAPGETRLSSDQHMVLEYIAHTYALMAQKGEGPAPLPDDRLWEELAGTRLFEAGKFGVVRTKNSIATFSWGAQVMGLVAPLRGDLLLTPEGRGLIGYVSAQEKKAETPLVKQVSVVDLKSGFGVLAVLQRAEGLVEQRLGFLALPDGRTIYVDRLELTGDALPVVLDLGTLGVLNDVNWPFHNGKRTLAYQDGTTVFSAAKAASDPVTDFTSPWLNLDGLGIVRLDASGPARYVPTPSSAAGRLEQRFHLNAPPPTALAGTKAGDVIAHSALVFFPNQSPAETARSADRCKLMSVGGDRLIALQLGDDTRVKFDLGALQLSVNPPSAAP